MRNLLSAAALLSIVAAPAFAQTTTPSPDPPASPPAATAPSTSTSSGQLQYHIAESGDHRASKLIGALVKNSGGQTIGDVNEIIISKDGKAAAAVLGVGGFLGMGEREVAVLFSSLNFALDANGDLTVMVPTATEESLKTAPEWKSTTR